MGFQPMLFLKIARVENPCYGCALSPPFRRRLLRTTALRAAAFAARCAAFGTAAFRGAAAADAARLHAAQRGHRALRVSSIVQADVRDEVPPDDRRGHAAEVDPGRGEGFGDAC